MFAYLALIVTLSSQHFRKLEILDVYAWKVECSQLFSLLKRGSKLCALMLLLSVGRKLHHIIESLVFGTERRPFDEMFWFNTPKSFFHIIHFVIFQNSYQLVSYIWIGEEFGWNSCIRPHMDIFVITLVVVGLIAQVFCGYNLLPCYALLTPNLSPGELDYYFQGELQELRIPLYQLSDEQQAQETGGEPVAETPAQEAETPVQEMGGEPVAETPAQETDGEPVAETPAQETGGEPVAETPAHETVDESVQHHLYFIC